MTERERLASPAFTTVISAEDIARSPANSIPDLLRDAVGVHNQSNANGRDEIQIRGMDGRYTLVLVDGRRVSSAGALWRGSDFDLTTVPLASIDRIEIVRGPMSALYGSDAIGGVVNIITKRPGKDWHGSLGAELRLIESGEEGRQQRVHAAASGALGADLSLAVAGEFYHRDAWFQHSAQDPKEVPGLEAKRSANLVSTLTWRVDPRQTLDLDLGYNRDKRPYALDSYVYYPAWNYEAFSYSEQQISRKTLGLSHRGRWDWGQSFTTYKRERARIDDFASSYDAPKQRHYQEHNDYLRSYAVSQVGAHALTGGVDLRRQEVRDPSTYLQTGRVRSTQYAAFMQDEFKASDAWLLTLGGRMDHHPSFGRHFSPKAYANYFLGSDVVVKGGVSTAFKAPDAYQLSPEYRIISCGGRCHLSGNPALTPEKSRSAEIGLEVTRADWEFSAVLFHNKVRDLIVAVYDPGVPSRAWKNVAQAKTQGIELGGSWQLSRAWGLKGSLTALKADFTDAAGQTVKLEFRPEHKLMAGVNWRANAALKVFLDLNYTGRQFYEDKSLPAYTRGDVGASLQLGRPWTLRAGIKNLGDVKLKDRNGKVIASELGRNLYLSASYGF
ncbi:TonB-dependent receptor [Mitsuaria sp. WAJ17]|uniref:TonB-dependent receptor plug domain-containing protein n=1 Tax=Mitsuaria sp. WAJ17 TaxID=2761452 RepID=UPI001602ED3E|nr:TonB-dependent receptor [Mitsuaria sp. WAJ17]MBB2485933.1 TonB-dependent receptor [Mitsuaria sp. WAJ17]